MWKKGIATKGSKGTKNQNRFCALCAFCGYFTAELAEGGALQIVEAFPCHRRDLHQIEIVLFAPAGEFLKFFGVRHIDLRGDDDFGFFRKGWIVLGEFGINGVEFVDGITTAHTGHVDQVKQHASAFDMLQELNSEAMAQMSAFNESGNIRNNERSIGVH